jgi:2-keto-3-deoxy-L-rhamnonate aldolase RhmA
MSTEPASSSLRERLLNGDVLVGCMISYDAPWLIDIAGLSGYDFVTIDMEHEPLGEEAAARLIRSCEAAGIPSILRVPMSNRVQALLNAGASGIQIPGVNTVQDARALVDATRFHPYGHRGFTLSTRSAGYGLRARASEYFAEANSRLAVIAMIEDISVVPELDSIMGIDGIDAFHIGPGDLAQSMGFPEEAKVQRVVDSIVSRLVARGRTVSVGTYAGTTPQMLSKQFYKGVRVFTVVLNRVLSARVQEVRSHVVKELLDASAHSESAARLGN